MTAPIVGVQWTGTIPANATQNWFTFNWPATWHMLWTAMPITPRPGGPELWFDVRVERASVEFATYWIQVRNLTPVPVTFEGRYAILSRYCREEAMFTGVQFTGTLGPNASNRWFTFNWPANWHVVWHVMPITPRPGAPELDWDVTVERASATNVTYWISVTNLTNQNVDFEGRYVVLN
jgi:hypothetical protein